MIDSVFDRPIVRPKVQSYFFLVTPNMLSVSSPQRSNNFSYRLKVMKGNQLCDEMRKDKAVKLGQDGKVKFQGVKLAFNVDYNPNKSVEFVLILLQFSDSNEEIQTGRFLIKSSDYINLYLSNNQLVFQQNASMTNKHKLSFNLYINNSKFALEKYARDHQLQIKQQQTSTPTKNSKQALVSETKSEIFSKDKIETAEEDRFMSPTTRKIVRKQSETRKLLKRQNSPTRSQESSGAKKESMKFVGRSKQQSNNQIQQPVQSLAEQQAKKLNAKIKQEEQKREKSRIQKQRADEERKRQDAQKKKQEEVAKRLQQSKKAAEERRIEAQRRKQQQETSRRIQQARKAAQEKKLQAARKKQQEQLAKKAQQAKKAVDQKRLEAQRKREQEQATRKLQQSQRQQQAEAQKSLQEATRKAQQIRKVTQQKRQQAKRKREQELKKKLQKEQVNLQQPRQKQPQQKIVKTKISNQLSKQFGPAQVDATQDLLKTQQPNTMMTTTRRPQKNKEEFIVRVKSNNQNSNSKKQYVFESSSAENQSKWNDPVNIRQTSSQIFNKQGKPIKAPTQKQKEIKFGGMGLKSILIIAICAIVTIFFIAGAMGSSKKSRRKK